MANIYGSVAVTGFIAPTAPSDEYAVTDEIYNAGGFRTVADIATRNLITPSRRRLGMIVYVIADKKYYQLQGGILDTNWVLGSFSTPSVNVVTSSTYTATEVAGNIILLANSASNSIIINLPTAINNSAIYDIKKTNAANSVTINTALSQTIDGSSSIVLALQYESITIVSDSINWNII